MINVWKILLLVLLVNVETNASSIKANPIDKSVNKTLLAGLCSKECNRVDVSLNGIINEILRRNYELYLEKMKVKTGEHKVSMEKGIFEPKFKISTKYSRTNVPNSAAESAARGFSGTYREKMQNLGISVGGLVPTGGEWEIGFVDRKRDTNLISKTEDYDAEYSDGFSISFKQPLLRGMGTDITYAKINMAKIQTEISKVEYKNKLTNLIATTIRLYWRLYGTQKLYESWKNTLIITRQQLKDIESLAHYGRIPKTEILEVKSSIFQKRTKLLSLKATITELTNRLLSLLNASSYSSYSTLFLAKDIPNIGTEKLTLDIRKSYKKSILYLPELKLAKMQLELAKLEYKYKESQQLVDLTLSTNISTLGLSSEKNNALYCSGGGCDNQISWSVELNLEVPLYGNEIAKENLAISKINLRNLELSIKAFHTEIYNTISTKIEHLKIEKLKLDEYREEVYLKTQLLNIERKRLKLGKSRMKNVLEYEDKLMSTKRRFFNSVVKFKVAEALLNKATGSLLAKQNIKLIFDSNNQNNIEKLNLKLLER